MRRVIALLICLLVAACPALAESPLLAAPDLPDMASYPNPDSPFGFTSEEDEAAYAAWRRDVTARYREIADRERLAPFLTASAQAILTGSGDANRVYSPLSLYMALAMLAESTAGDARAELLTLLGSDDIAALRRQAGEMWNANYRDDGTMTRTLATSLWLSDAVPFRQDTVQTLAGSYYASVYRGRMGSPALDAALQKWLDDNTLGLLTDQAQSVQLPDGSLAAIASAVALRARWDSEFYEGDTAPDVFHAPGGDVTCDFMRTFREDWVYWGDRFTAACLPFDMSGAMWLILPDEGVSVDALLADAQVQPLLTGSGRPAMSSLVKLHLSVPKFDISSQLELSDSLQALGVTEVFGPGADFSPLTEANLPISLSQVRHDARVTIDEEGCEAAAYTVMILDRAACPQEREEFHLTLDRPFLFVITGAQELPLFVGVVNQP